MRFHFSFQFPVFRFQFPFPVSISLPFPAFPYVPTEATEHLLNVAGTSQLVNPEILPMASLSDQSGELCRKDTGSKKLRKWSRGHQFVVRGGGHIDAWQPLYK